MDENSIVLKRNNFINSLKCVENSDIMYLVQMQKKLEIEGISMKKTFDLTQNLSDLQKEKLKDLYKEQIIELKMKIKNHKEKILKIKNQL